jgi:hypothetical protein
MVVKMWRIILCSIHLTFLTPLIAQFGDNGEFLLYRLTGGEMYVVLQKGFGFVERAI